jgi:hypothetical protein
MSYLLADTYTASAEDTEVIVTVEERVIILYLQSSVSDGIRDLLQVQIVNEFRELALAVARTVLTARGYGCLADCALKVIAIVSAFTHQACVGVLG